jgi:enediyne biosynthesis thioesterase
VRAYEYRHVVSFEDTNLVGNVYFTKHLSWQGRCREAFLRERAPEVFAAVGDGLALVTVNCSCTYLAELTAGDDVVVRMRLSRLSQTSMALDFDYVTVRKGREVRVARGAQEVACMRRTADGLVPALVPAALVEALMPYADTEHDREDEQRERSRSPSSLLQSG